MVSRYLIKLSSNGSNCTAPNLSSVHTGILTVLQRVPVPLPKLPPPLRIGSPQHLHWPNPFPASTWSSRCSGLFCLEGFGESSGFYHGKLKSATTAFCPLHVVMLKCRRHSVSINSLVPQTVKNPPAVQETQVRSLGWEDPPWRRKWQPTLVFLPGAFHRQRSLVGYSPWGCKRVRHN